MNILSSQSPLHPSTLNAGKHICKGKEAPCSLGLSKLCIMHRQSYPCTTLLELSSKFIKVAFWALEGLCRGATSYRPFLVSPAVIHRTQHWFHGRISREESHRIIKQQGLVDG